MGTRVYWLHGVGHCAEYLPCVSFRELDVRGEQPGLFGSLSHPQLPEHYPSQERHRPWNLCFRQSSEQGQQGRHTSPNDGGGDQAPAHAHGRLARKRGNQVQPEALHCFFMLLLCCLRCVCSCLEVCLELPRGTGYYFQALYCHSPDLGQPQPGVVITPLSLLHSGLFWRLSFCPGWSPVQCRLSRCSGSLERRKPALSSWCPAASLTWRRCFSC